MKMAVRADFPEGLQSLNNEPQAITFSKINQNVVKDERLGVNL